MIQTMVRFQTQRDGPAVTGPLALSESAHVRALVGRP